MGDNIVPGGIDTNLAEHMLTYFCRNSTQVVSVLDACGGHATPYHYHERMSCLYTPSDDGHSTRIGTAADGHGIYGRYIAGGVEPTDLDVCGGRWGVTPDSDGEVVYYYPISSRAPFSLGCYGPVESVEECRALYPDTCGEEAAQVVVATTEYGSGLYTLDCPCFDKNESNVVGQARPGYLAPLEEPDVVAAAPIATTNNLVPERTETTPVVELGSSGAKMAGMGELIALLVFVLGVFW